MRNYVCRICGAPLIDTYICKPCDRERIERWRKANPDKAHASGTKSHRKAGHLPYNENKTCSSFLGVHVAERVLSHVFNDVERMPLNNPGYDIICNHNKRIDIKSSCLSRDKTTMRWGFHIERNTIADYFLCIAFNNREDLTPIHVWLIPGDKLNRLIGTTIRPTTVKRWETYEIDLTQILRCCDTLKHTT